MEQSTPRLPQGRAQLVRVLSVAGDVIHVDDVAIALQLDRTAAAQRLSRWAEQGWLRRGGGGNGKLITHATRLSNGTVFKRLGFRTERTPEGTELTRLYERHLSDGHANLDPAQYGPYVVTKWRLRVPQVWAREGTA